MAKQAPASIPITSSIQQKGVALLAAIIFMLAIVLTLGNIFYSHQVDVLRLTKSLHSDQALLLGLSAENWARQLLSTEQDDREIDSLEENWAIAVPVMPVEGGFLRGCLKDLQARVNLNTFAEYNSANLAAEMENEGNGYVKLWLGLLRQNELPYNEASVATIIDWVDSDNEEVSEFGAEQDSYDFNREQVMVANSLVTDIEELAVMRAYGPMTLSLLEPWLTALPKATTININTAPEMILQAMGGENPQVFKDYVLRQRPFYSLDEFYDGLSTALNIDLAEVKSLWSEDFVGIKSDYFLLQLEINLGESRLRIDSLLGRFNRNEPVVVARKIKTVPAIIARLNTAENSLADEQDPLQAGFCEQAQAS